MVSETEQILSQLAQRVGPSILGLGRGARGGTAVIVGPDQAITLARNLRAEEVTARFGDGRETPARLVGVEGTLDVAVLSLDCAGAPAVGWGDGPVALGTAVFALADPGGRGLRVTAGHVSAGPRSFRGPRGRLIGDVIEHTAPLPRGSGGAALVDAGGRLLGLNAVRADGGLVWALPATALPGRLGDVVAAPRAEPVRLGVAVAPPLVGRRMRGAVGLPEHDGLLVRAVEERTPADRAGVRRGDLIVALAGAPTPSVEDLLDALDAAPRGATLDLDLLRGVEPMRLTVSLSGAEEE